MASMSDVKITFEFEPLVKLSCMSTKCRNNMRGSCNLKRLYLDEQGMCAWRTERAAATRREEVDDGTMG